MSTTTPMEKMVEAAERVVELDDVGEYGYGGDVVSSYIVSNWPEVVKAVLRALVEEVV